MKTMGNRTRKSVAGSLLNNIYDMRPILNCVFITFVLHTLILPLMSVTSRS